MTNTRPASAATKATSPTKQNDRPRTHIKAMIEVLKEEPPEQLAQPAGLFISGMLTGLAASAQILDGGTAEQAMEAVPARLEASIGRAYLNGTLPATPPKTDPTAKRRQVTAEQDACVDWQAIAERRERELKTVGEARHAAEQRAENFEGRAKAYEQRAADRADRIASLLISRDQLRARLAEQEAETMRQLERAQQAEAAIARVRALHHPADHGGVLICAECSGYDGLTTDNSPCGYEHCPTIAALEGLTSSATDAVVGTARQEMVAELGDDHRNVEPEEALAYHAMGLSIRVDRAEAERDGAYRERAYLVALLAAMTDGAVIAPAPDVEEPGWQIAYLTIGGRQASWHISPRDTALFADVEHVPGDDPRARWDGHSTDDKYARIRQHTRLLARRCGPACAEAHTYSGRCEGAHQVDDSDTTAPDVVHPDATPQPDLPEPTSEQDRQELAAALGGDRTASVIAHTLHLYGRTLADVRAMTDEELLAIPGLGATSLATIRLTITTTDGSEQRDVQQ
ncbi:hypothetical protein L1I79_27550 [Strepomyces sp. STD 3.1]|nr:hypothetical protein [Streptomyces sp. STD 3.1]